MGGFWESGSSLSRILVIEVSPSEFQISSIKHLESRVLKTGKNFVANSGIGGFGDRRPGFGYREGTYMYSKIRGFSEFRDSGSQVVYLMLYSP